MPADSLGGCDSLTVDVSENFLGQNSELFLNYSSDWQTLFINAKNITGKNCNITIYDQTGKLVYASSKQTISSYFTSQINMSNYSNGLYILILQTESEKLTGKFVKF